MAGETQMRIKTKVNLCFLLLYSQPNPLFQIQLSDISQSLSSLQSAAYTGIKLTRLSFDSPTTFEIRGISDIITYVTVYIPIRNQPYFFLATLGLKLISLKYAGNYNT